jgi:hypothetical protein
LCNVISAGEDAAVPRKYIDDISAALSTAINTNRVNDKSELSNVLSTYTNTVSAALSTAINTTAAKFSTLSIYNDKTAQ